MNRSALITTYEALVELHVENVEEMSSSSRCNLMARLVERHGLDQYPDPDHDRRWLYSRAQCRAAHQNLKPAPRKQAA